MLSLLSGRRDFLLELSMVVLVLISHIVAQVGVLVLLKHLTIKHDAGMRLNSFGHYVFLTTFFFKHYFPCGRIVVLVPERTL